MERSHTQSAEKNTTPEAPTVFLPKGAQVRIGFDWIHEGKLPAGRLLADAVLGEAIEMRQGAKKGERYPAYGHIVEVTEITAAEWKRERPDDTESLSEGSKLLVAHYASEPGGEADGRLWIEVLP